MPAYGRVACVPHCIMRMHACLRCLAWVQVRSGRKRSSDDGSEAGSGSDTRTFLARFLGRPEDVNDSK